MIASGFLSKEGNLHPWFLNICIALAFHVEITFFSAPSPKRAVHSCFVLGFNRQGTTVDAGGGQGIVDRSAKSHLGAEAEAELTTCPLRLGVFCM